MFRTSRVAQLLALLAILIAAPSAQASIFDDIIGIGEGIIDDIIDVGEGIIDVGDEVCDLTPWLPICLIIENPIICINPPCDEIEPPTPGPFYRYYAATTGEAKTKIKEVGYDKGDYAWMVEYDDENGFVAYDTYGYEYSGSVFPIGSKPGKFQLQLDDASLDVFSQYLSERASSAAGTPVTLVLTELPVIKLKELEGGLAKVKIKARAQAATAEGLYPARYKCKMYGEQGDKLAPIEILPVALETL